MNTDLPLLRALHQVSGSSRATSPAALARRLRRDPAAVRASLERLEEAGWVWLRGPEVRLTLPGLCLAVAHATPERKRPAPVAARRASPPPGLPVVSSLGGFDA